MIYNMFGNNVFTSESNTVEFLQKMGEIAVVKYWIFASIEHIVSLEVTSVQEVFKKDSKKQKF